MRTKIEKLSTGGGLPQRLARLPGWVWAALAVLIALPLHRAAGARVPPRLLLEPAQLAQRLLRGDAAWTTTLAGIAQYLLPALLLLIALYSALRRRRRRALLARVAQEPAALDAIGWRPFELLVGEVFRRQGYSVTELGGARADGGVDLLLEARGATLLVQCKHWKAQPVGVVVVRELYGVIAASGAAGGFVVTSGRFSAAANEFARGLAVTLVDGARLRVLVREAWAAARAGARAEPIPDGPAPASGRETCKLCSRPMVRRTARRGPHAGREFWGCSGYPACRARRPID